MRRIKSFWISRLILSSVGFCYFSELKNENKRKRSESDGVFNRWRTWKSDLRNWKSEEESKQYRTQHCWDLYIYYLDQWSNFSRLHNSQWISNLSPTQTKLAILQRIIYFSFYALSSLWRYLILQLTEIQFLSIGFLCVSILKSFHVQFP